MKNLKFFLVIISLLILGIIILNVLVDLNIGKHNNILAEWYVQENLKRINKALLLYSENHEGNLPKSSEWADMLLKENPLLSKHDFISRISYPSYGICFNKSLGARQIGDYPKKTVILFTAKGNWNSSADKSYFFKVAADSRYQYLITINGEIFEYDTSKDVITNLDSLQEVTPESLDW